MDDAKKIELLIHKMHQDGKEASLIADEVLKLWNKNLLSFSEKISAGLFCLKNGFLLSLISALRKDLQKSRPVCWPLVFQTLVQPNKEVIDACLIGAGTEHKLLELTIAALEIKNPDPRWKKILTQEIAEKNRTFFIEKEKMLGEMKFLESQKLSHDAFNILQRLKKMFPQDQQIKTELQRYQNWELLEKLSKLRQKYPPIHPEYIQEQIPLDEDFKKDVLTQARNLDLENLYDLSIGFHTIGHNHFALELLREKNTEWTIREQLYEIELLVELKNFAEALELCQIILDKKAFTTEIVYACVYNMAHCYYGLKDFDQALQTLRALHSQRPDYRNTRELIIIWEKEI